MKLIKTIISTVVLLSIILFVSCNKNEDGATLSITLLDDNGQLVNNNNTLGLSIPSPAIKLHIQGGDANYTISNSNNDVVAVQHDKATITLKPAAIGKSTITINDHSEKSYSLQITVTQTELLSVNSYRCLIYGDALIEKDKADLNSEMLSLIKGYEFIPNINNSDTGVIKVFGNESDGSTYKEYDFRYRGEIPQSCQPIKFNIQIESWYVLKSKDEELVLFITDYISPTEEITGLRSSSHQYYSLVMDVTNRYKAKYPKIEKAYIVQR